MTLVLFGLLDEAIKFGFHNGHPEWANLGQGEPEVGEMVRLSGLKSLLLKHAIIGMDH